jgi:FkbM family methyltransferase
MKLAIKRLVNFLGFQISRYSIGGHPISQFNKLLELYKVDVVLDVGANTGQFYHHLRSYNRSVKVISVEAIPDLVNKLKLSAKDNSKWEIVGPLAIAGSNGDVKFDISGNSVSSSLKKVLQKHIEAEVSSECVEVITVPAATLDHAIQPMVGQDEVLALKIEVQGAEYDVIQGAENCIAQAAVIICELSLQPLYEDQKLWLDIIREFEARGMILCGLHTGFACGETGETLQVEGLFKRINNQA